MEDNEPISVSPRTLLEMFVEIGIPKLEANEHKGNPFRTDLFELLIQADDEKTEALEAMAKFMRKPSHQNRNEVLVEISDVINQWAIIGGKIKGFIDLDRAGNN